MHYRSSVTYIQQRALRYRKDSYADALKRSEKGCYQIMVLFKIYYVWLIINPGSYYFSEIDKFLWDNVMLDCGQNFETIVIAVWLAGT